MENIAIGLEQDFERTVQAGDTPDDRHDDRVRSGHGTGEADGLVVGLPRLILQYPGGGPLKVTSDQDGVPAVNANRTG